MREVVGVRVECPQMRPLLRQQIDRAPLRFATIESVIGTAPPAAPPLQEVLIAQPAVLIGLIAHIVGTPLQDDIVRTTGRLLRLGQDILATSAARAATPRA